MLTGAQRETLRSLAMSDTGLGRDAAERLHANDMAQDAANAAAARQADIDATTPVALAKIAATEAFYRSLAKSGLNQ